MLLGLVIILCGILIAVYPPLLSIIVATLLIFLGMLIFGISYRYKKMSRRMEDPLIDFFMRI